MARTRVGQLEEGGQEAHRGGGKVRLVLGGERGHGAERRDQQLPRGGEQPGLGEHSKCRQRPGKGSESVWRAGACLALLRCVRLACPTSTMGKVTGEVADEGRQQLIERLW